MALHRGIQSAIFYYLSCAPCAEARYRKERKQEAARGRADRAALEAEMPNLYRHPSPSSTNPHWGSEIAAGPVLSSRGGRRKAGYSQSNNGSQRRLKTPPATATSLPRVGIDDDGGGTGGLPSSIDVRASGSLGSRDGAAAVSSQYRDGDPWAAGMASAERLPSRSTTFSASTFGHGGVGPPRKPPRAVTRSPDGRRGDYTQFSNPTVNDLVPAIATHVASKEEARSLMLGPPSSEYMMAGGSVDGGPRSRSNSGVSSGRLSARSTGVPPSRELSRRVLDRRLHSRETVSSARTPSRSTSQLGLVEAKDFGHVDDDGAPGGTAPVSMTTTESRNPVIIATVPVQRPSSRRRLSRPQLSTVISSDHVSTISNDDPTADYADDEEDEDKEEEEGDDENTNHRRRTPVRPFLNGNRTDLLSSHRFPSEFGQNARHRADCLDPGGHHHLHLPPMRESKSTDSVLLNPAKEPRRGRDWSETQVAAAMFDSWYTPDFALPEWVHEHTKREVSHRWSMDF